ncbi:MAG TPA: anthranilate/aminodeoxychorismate synthase component II [Thermoanaerobaculia bacterium]|nr:anthranilate/aminodeoxychorismate synthase component II [Thermoanaerobaculia bacterium]
MRVLVLDNGDPCLENLLGPLRELGAECEVRPSGSLKLRQIRDMSPQRILMTPGPGRPEDTGACLDVVISLAGEIPVAGIGLGMQVIIHVTHYPLVPARKVRRKTATIRHDGKNLFAGLPSPINAPRDPGTSLILDGRRRPSNDLEVSAWDENGTTVGCRVWGLGLEGVQVDTKWFSTRSGQDILFNFLYQAQIW